MGAERFVITTSIDGKGYKKVWRAGKPLTLGYPFHLKISRIKKGIHVETLPSGHDIQQGIESQKRSFEFGDEVPVKGFDLRLRRATRAQDDSELVVNILPAAGFTPVFSPEAPQKEAWWVKGGNAALAGPKGQDEALYAFACMGSSVQDFARADAGYVGTIGGRTIFRLKKLKNDQYQFHASVQGVELKTPTRIFYLDKHASSSEMSEHSLRHAVVSFQSSDWYFSNCPILKAEEAKREREDERTEWFQKAIQSCLVGFFSLMVMVSTWPTAPKRTVKEVVIASVEQERPKEVIVLPPEPVVVPEPAPSPIALVVEEKKPEPVKAEPPKPEPVKAAPVRPAPVKAAPVRPAPVKKPEPPKPNKPVPKKAQAPAPKPIPHVEPKAAQAPAPKLAQTPEPVKAPPQPSPEQKAAKEAAVRAEAARVAEAQKQAEIARLAEQQRLAEVRKTEEAKAKIGAALGFMANSASTVAVKSGDYNKEGKEIAYAESSGTSELAKATGKSTALGTLARTGMGDGTLETKSGKQINGTAVNGGGKGGVGNGKVMGRVATSGSKRGPGDGSFGMSQGGVRVEGQGSINQSMLEAVMKKNLEKFQYCYEKALLTNATLSGSVVVSWVISLQGGASSVNVVKSQMQSESLHRCLGREIQRIAFPPAKGGPVIVKYPFNFSSSSL